MRLPGPVEAGAWLLSAALLAVAAAWPSWTVGRARSAAWRAAEATVQRVVAEERRVLAERGRFAGFGPTGAERAAALGAIDLGRDGSFFDIDALLDETGILHVRVLSRPDAVRNGDITPVVQQVELDPRSPMGGS